MLIPRTMIDDFFILMKSYYGITMKLNKKGDEYSRCYLNGIGIVMLRDPPGGESEMLEVFCGNKDKLKEIQESWNMLLFDKFKGDYNAEESNN